MAQSARSMGPAQRVSAGVIQLRPTRHEDLGALYQLQTDPESNEMAGTKPRTREAFYAAWERHLTDPAIKARVIELDGVIVGSIACFQAEGRDCIGYWIARTHWGMGITSRALRMFLDEERRRPLHATVSGANAASRRVLEKCGFRCVGRRAGEETDRFAAREIADYVLHDGV